MAPHSSTLAWKIPWTEEPGRLPSMGLHRVGHDWSDLAAAAAVCLAALKSCRLQLIKWIAKSFSKTKQMWSVRAATSWSVLDFNVGETLLSRHQGQWRRSLLKLGTQAGCHGASNLHKQVRWGRYHIASTPSKTANLLIYRNLVLLYNKFHIHYEKRKKGGGKKERRKGRRKDHCGGTIGN